MSARTVGLGDSDSSIDDSVTGRFNFTTHTVQSGYNLRTSGGLGRAARSANTVRGASRRKRRDPRRLALREIAKYQKSTELLVPKLPFARIVREITMELNSEVTRYTFVALQALQEATEMYIVQYLQDAYYLTLHRKRVTLSKGDMHLIKFLKYM